MLEKPYVSSTFNAAFRAGTCVLVLAGILRGTPADAKPEQQRAVLQLAEAALGPAPAAAAASERPAPSQPTPFLTPAAETAAALRARQRQQSQAAVMLRQLAAAAEILDQFTHSGSGVAAFQMPAAQWQVLLVRGVAATHVLLLHISAAVDDLIDLLGDSTAGLLPGQLDSRLPLHSAARASYASVLHWAECSLQPRLPCFAA